MAHDLSDFETQELITELEKRGKEVNATTENHTTTRHDFTKLDNGSYYDINGLRVVQNPDEYLVDINRTGPNFHGAKRPQHAPRRLIPNPSTEYRSIALPGGVTSIDEIIEAITGPRPTLLLGEAGVAKNTAIDTIAQQWGIPVYRANMGGDTSVYNLIAKETAIDGTAAADLQPMGKAALFGGIVIGDEINTLTGDISSHIHASIEEKGGRRISLPGIGRELVDLPENQTWDPKRHTGRYIHPLYRFVGTGNPLNYAGTKKPNSAFLDRFRIIVLDTLPKEEEAKLLVSEVDADMNDAMRLVNFAADLREMYPKPLSTPITHRRLQMALTYAQAHDTDLVAGVKTQIMSYATREHDRNIIADAVTDSL